MSRRGGWLVPAAQAAIRRPRLVLALARCLLATRSPRAAAARVRDAMRSPAGCDWSAAAPYFGLAPGARAELDARAAAALDAGSPLISLVTPLHATPPAFLHACVCSVLHQPYARFELILVDDGSPDPATLRQARSYAAQDPRVRVVARTRNGGVSRASNDGLAAAGGAWTAFLDHDDELTPDALVAVAERLRAEPALDAVYTDQLKVDVHGRVIDHHFKPDWSPIHALGVMYVGHLLVVRTALARAVGGFDPAFDGVQDYDFLLRLSERTAAIGHIALPLYKWRASPASLAADSDAKAGVDALQRCALAAHLARRGRSWAVEPHPEPRLRQRMVLAPSARTAAPRVSVVIPTRDQGAAVARCLDTLFDLTDHPAFEVLLVDNGTTDPVALEAFERHPARRIGFDQPFNFSRACNAGAAAARGEHLVFLNNDTEVLQADWLRRLQLYLEDPRVGAVGPVLLYPDRTVQHAGVVLGARGTADHVMRRFPAHVDGYAGSLSTAREVSAVTAACLMIPRRLFVGLGGFCADYAAHYQDVDLCLRLRERGLSVICAARPTLVHHESLTRAAGGYDFGDRALLIDRWRERLEAHDPYFSPWLDRQRLDYSLAA
ncbi:MAG: glycosyltransferase [Caulobacteraceae bacterium]|nr:glycosyltransferase [Caulobacter sp.]